MLLIPAIDLKDGKCVRLRQGRMDEDTVYSDDPVAMAEHWVEAGARRLHIVQVTPPSEREPGDGRKHHHLHLEWNKARLSLAQAQGCVTPQCAATLGDPDDAGDPLKHGVIQAGMGKNTAVHGVGDGAPWIAAGRTGLWRAGALCDRFLLSV